MKNSSLLIGLVPGGLVSGITVYLFASGHWFWGIIMLLVSFATVLFYSGSVTGAVAVYGISALVYEYNNAESFVFLGYFLACLFSYVMYRCSNSPIKGRIN